MFTAPSEQIISIGQSIACSPKNLSLDDTAETFPSARINYLMYTGYNRC